jgi:hypothetical protein
MPQGDSMSGDRSDYREFYPQILEVDDSVFQQRIEEASTLDEKQYFSNLLEDVKQIRSGVQIAPWPNNDLVKIIKETAAIIALLMLFEISDVDEVQEHLDSRMRGTRNERVKAAREITELITPEEIDALKFGGLDLKTIYIDTPEQRLLKTDNLQNPFSMADRNLSPIDFPISQNMLDETHSYIVRGHGWFGVGQWNIASQNYIKALAKALATNNHGAVGGVARFLVDTYAAAGETNSAVNLAVDYLQSSAYTVETLKYPTEIAESACVALALSNKWSESIQWLEKISSISKQETNRSIETWRVVDLLSDVYQYKNDNTNLSHLNKVIKALAGHL